MQELKDIIKNRRAEVGKTLEQVANEVGVSKATVQRWESGEIKDMRRDKIVALARALNTTPAYIMGWTASIDGSDKPTRESVTVMMESVLRSAGHLRPNETLTPEMLSSINVALHTAIELYRKSKQ